MNEAEKCDASRDEGKKERGNLPCRFRSTGPTADDNLDTCHDKFGLVHFVAQRRHLLRFHDERLDPGTERGVAAEEDPLEDIWLIYTNSSNLPSCPDTIPVQSAHVTRRQFQSHTRWSRIGDRAASKVTIRLLG